MVGQTKVIREPETIHVQVSFTSEPLDYTSLDDYVSLSFQKDTLRLLSFKKTGASWNLYFEKPKKEGAYTLKIANTLMDTDNNELDTNENSITEEEDDNYLEKLVMPFVVGNYFAYVFKEIDSVVTINDNNTIVPVSLKEVVLTDTNATVLEQSAFNGCEHIEYERIALSCEYINGLM